VTKRQSVDSTRPVHSELEPRAARRDVRHRSMTLILQFFSGRPPEVVQSFHSAGPEVCRVTQASLVSAD
jgi:hypothetical protein